MIIKGEDRVPSMVKFPNLGFCSENQSSSYNRAVPMSLQILHCNSQSFTLCSVCVASISNLRIVLQWLDSLTSELPPISSGFNTSEQLGDSRAGPQCDACTFLLMNTLVLFAEFKWKRGIHKCWHEKEEKHRVLQIFFPSLHTVSKVNSLDSGENRYIMKIYHELAN